MCMAPLIHIPSAAISSELKIYQRLQLHRLADLSFADTKALLYQEKIPWESICTPKKDKTLLFKDTVSLNLKKTGDRTFERTCYIWSSPEKCGKDNEKYYLVHVEIHFSAPSHPHFFPKKKMSSFPYQVFVKKIA